MGLGHQRIAGALELGRHLRNDGGQRREMVADGGEPRGEKVRALGRGAGRLGGRLRRLGRLLRLDPFLDLRIAQQVEQLADFGRLVGGGRGGRRRSGVQGECETEQGQQQAEALQESERARHDAILLAHIAIPPTALPVLPVAAV